MTLGVAVLIIVMSVASGFDLMLRERLLNFGSHIKVFTQDRVMTEYRELRETVLENESVTGVAPFVGPVMVETQPDEGLPQIYTPYIRGVDIDLEPTVSSLVSTNSLSRVNWISTAACWSARKFVPSSSSTGDYLAVHSARSFLRIREAQEEGSELVLLPDDYEVRGIVDAGYFEYNANFMHVARERAGPARPGDAARVGRTTEGRLTGGADPRATENPAGRVGGANVGGRKLHLLEALRVERNVMFYLLFFV